MTESGSGTGSGAASSSAAPMGSGQALNHGPGSFAHNNSDQLPSGARSSLDQMPSLRTSFDQSRDPMIAAQMRDLGKTEAQRRDATQNPKSRDAFKASRRSHAPLPAPMMRPDNAKAADRRSFAARQREEFIQARKAAVARPMPSKTQAPAPDKQAVKDQFRAAAQNAAAPDLGAASMPNRGL